MARKKSKAAVEPSEIKAIRHKDTRKNIPTEELRDFVGEEEQRRRRCSTRATPRSTRSSSGRARTSRTARTLWCRRVPIYIQEKIDPRRSSRTSAAPPPNAPTTSQSSTLFADFDGLDGFDSGSTSTSTTHTGRTA